MSDWVTMGEEGMFTPDTIYHLERRLTPDTEAPG
jgi:hypothetical protein